MLINFIKRVIFTLKELRCFPILPLNFNMLYMLPVQTLNSQCVSFFNKGTCSRNSNHIVGHVSYKHFRSNCMRAVSKEYNHPATQCRRKDGKWNHITSITQNNIPCTYLNSFISHPMSVNNVLTYSPITKCTHSQIAYELYAIDKNHSSLSMSEHSINK